MALKAIADCDLCKAEFHLKMEEGRRGWSVEEDTSVCADFSISKSDSYIDNEVYFDTVCKSCRMALKKAFNAEVYRLKAKAKKAK